MTTNNKPVAEVHDGNLKIALFRNPPKEEGDRARYSGKLTRSYRDASGQWQWTWRMDNARSVLGRPMHISVRGVCQGLTAIVVPV